MPVMNHSLRAGEVTPGEFFEDREKREIRITYSHGEGHMATCTIEQGYSLSMDEREIAENLRLLGYQLIGSRTEDGTPSPHMENFLTVLDEKTKSTLISVRRDPKFVAEAGTAWMELIFAKYWSNVGSENIVQAVKLAV
jgi:hypothetical protein